MKSLRNIENTEVRVVLFHTLAVELIVENAQRNIFMSKPKRNCRRKGKMSKCTSSPN